MKNNFFKIKKKKTLKDTYFALVMIILAMMVFYWFFKLYTEMKNSIVACSVFLIIYYVSCELYKYRRKQKYLESSLSDLDKLEGIEFEEYCKVMFESRGYKAKLTPPTHDYGADLVIVGKDGMRIVVQAKRYKGLVGIEAVQQVIGSKAYYNAENCIVITTSYFTDAAKELARVNNVALCDRNFLMHVTKN